MDKRIETLMGNWQKRNIRGLYFSSKEEAVAQLLKMIPASGSIGLSGSRTLEELGIVNLLASRGNHTINQYKPGISREESLELRRQSVAADYYLASANAVSETGELVFLSAFGHRTAGVSLARNVFILCGKNKLTPSLEEALKRAREYVTPLNCKRLNWKAACLEDGICHNASCFGPEFRRMCCQVLVIEAEIEPGRLTVILVDENLGF